MPRLYAVFPGYTDVPPELHQARQGERTVPVLDSRGNPDPFLQGFYAAASFAYTSIFGDLLGTALFEDAVFMSDPPVEI